jgi:Rhodopirellula transposase DDE domain
MSWRGRPLTSLRTIIELISATTTTTGLTIQAADDPSWYPTGVKVTDAELAAVPLSPHEWHGDPTWLKLMRIPAGRWRRLRTWLKSSGRGSAAVMAYAEPVVPASAGR